MPVSAPRCLWIGADDADRLGRGLEQDVVHDRLVLERDGGDGRRHGEDDVEIRDRQQVGLTIGQPLGARQALALGAVPVATAVVGDADHAAVVALLDMPAERRGAASLDRGHDAALVGQEPTALRGTERIAMAAEDVRHLQRGAHRRATREGSPPARADRMGSAFRRSGPVATWA